MYQSARRLKPGVILILIHDYNTTVFCFGFQELARLLGSGGKK